MTHLRIQSAVSVTLIHRAVWLFAISAAMSLVVCASGQSDRPGNDDFVSALRIEGENYASSLINDYYATHEEFELESLSRTLWFEWTAPEHLVVRVETVERKSTDIPRIPRALRVYLGDSPRELQSVAGKGETFLACKGLTYRINTGQQSASATGYTTAAAQRLPAMLPPFSIKLTSTPLPPGTTVVVPELDANALPRAIQPISPQAIRPQSLPATIIGYTRVGERAQSLEVSSHGYAYFGQEKVRPYESILWFSYTAERDERLSFASLPFGPTSSTHFTVFRGDLASGLSPIGARDVTSASVNLSAGSRILISTSFSPGAALRVTRSPD